MKTDAQKSEKFARSEKTWLAFVFDFARSPHIHSITRKTTVSVQYAYTILANPTRLSLIRTSHSKKLAA